MKNEDLDRNFGFLTLDVARLLQYEFDKRVNSLGLTRSQIRVLTRVYQMPGISQSELTDILDVQKAALGRMVDRLNQKGWLERRSDPNDRRVNRIHLTKEVSGLMKKTRVIAAEIRSLAMSDISVESREDFIDTLVKIKSNLTSFQEKSNDNN